MDIANACRVCLTTFRSVHFVKSLDLRDMYEKLAECKLMTDDNRPTALCYICMAQLRKCSDFARAAKVSEKFLTELLHSVVPRVKLTSQSSIFNYSISPTEYVCLKGTECDDIEKVDKSIALQLEVPFKTETGDGDPMEKEEPPPVKTERDDIFEDSILPSDSEDDVPLNTLKTESKTVKPKRKYVKNTKLYAREVTLTKEQQIQNLRERAMSLNYLNSPYKCELCYKGFVSLEAYDNHKEKHNERSGEYACDVCQLRYASARLLRAHAHSAHDRLYMCHKCTHVSHTIHQANDHERWHEGHKYECQLCGQKFNKRTSYLTHARTRHAAEHACAACGGSFLSPHGLRMHRTKAHRTRQIIEDGTDPTKRYCTECNVQFVTLDAWRRHILNSVKHTLKAEHSKQCPICDVTISTDTTISEHMKKHEKMLRKNRPTVCKDSIRAQVSCEQCSASFSNKSKLQAHIKRIHLGIKYNKNVVCEVCGKKCTSNAALAQHQRSHSGARPHSCATCHKRFSNTNQLRIHTRVHSGDRPYVCHTCSTRFSQKPSLNRHYRVHTGAKPYVCQFCSKSFSQSNSLKVHVKAVHEKVPYRKQKPMPEEKPLENTER